MKKNVAYVLLSVFSLQGASYIAQILLAKILSIEDYSIVRTVESTLQVLASLAPLGISMLAVKITAQNKNMSNLKSAFSSYILYAICAGFVIAGVGSVILTVFGFRPSDHYLLILISVLIFTNISRTIFNYYYGNTKFALVSIVIFVISLANIPILFILTQNFGLVGWVVSKYLIEICFLLAFVYLSRSLFTTKLIDFLKFKKLFVEGSNISLSLVFRSLIDNIPLMALAYYASFNVTDIAVFGLCTLLINCGSLLPSSYISVLLPKYSELSIGDIFQLYNLHYKNLKIVFLISLASCLGVVFFGFIMITFWVNKYGDIMIFILLSSMVIPFKAMTVLNANILFVFGWAKKGMIINMIASIVLILMYYILATHDKSNIYFTIFIALTVEIILYFVFFYSAKKCLWMNK